MTESTYGINYLRIPKHMRYGMRLYVERGVRPGGFLTAVLKNDLVGAITRADEVNQAHIHDWVMFVLNELPIGCWGSEEKVELWCKAGGAGKMFGVEKFKE